MRFAFCPILLGAAHSRSAVGRRADARGTRRSSSRAETSSAWISTPNWPKRSRQKPLLLADQHLLGAVDDGGRARGETQAEMAKTLHLDEDLAQAHTYYQKLLERWNAAGEKRPYELAWPTACSGKRAIRFVRSFWN